MKKAINKFVRNLIYLTNQFIKIALPIVILLLGFYFIVDSFHVDDEKRLFVLSCGFVLLLTGMYLIGGNNNTGSNLKY